MVVKLQGLQGSSLNRTEEGRWGFYPVCQAAVLRGAWPQARGKRKSPGVEDAPSGEAATESFPSLTKSESQTHRSNTKGSYIAEADHSSGVKFSLPES